MPLAGRCDYQIEEALAKDDQLAVIPLLTVFEFNKIRSNLNEASIHTPLTSLPSHSS